MVTRISQPVERETIEMDPSDGDVITFARGDIAMWIDSGTLHLKCVTKQGDPVELNADEVAELLQVIGQLVREMD